ncbi:MAG: ATP-binding cassette domain-containing protein, partial [Legionellales bacterium]
MLNIQNLAVQYGRQELFHQATFQCRPNQRFGITGKNGAGKSSLLRIISGQEKPANGEVHIPSGAQIGMLSQDHFSYESWPVVDVVISGNKQLWNAFKVKEELLSKADFTEEDGILLGTLEEQIAHHRGYEAQSIAQTLLSGLGIVQEKHLGTMGALSGGFKLRVLLAQVLFQNPDILLLDEPTNHLDITSIHWLEEYLKTEFEGIVLFVSHDKHFLNSV